MSDLTVAMLVTDAKRASVISAINALTPAYTIGFIRQCCAADTVDPTWQTPATHWYNNSTAVDLGIVEAWQQAVANAEPPDPLYGLIIFTAQNAADAVGWAMSNLASQNLMFVPDPA